MSNNIFYGIPQAVKYNELPSQNWVDPKDEIKKKLKEIHERVVDACKGEMKRIVRDRSFISGGSIASLWHKETVHDYDFYFVSPGDAQQVMMLVLNGINGNDMSGFTDPNKLLFKKESQYALTFHLESDTPENFAIVQFIFKFAGPPQDVVSKFDFQHCMSFYVPTIDYLNLNPASSGKWLQYNEGAAYPLAALKRAMKFQKRGWSIDDHQLGKIAREIGKIGLDKPEVLEDQLAGMYRVVL